MARGAGPCPADRPWAVPTPIQETGFTEMANLQKRAILRQNACDCSLDADPFSSSSIAGFVCSMDLRLLASATEAKFKNWSEPMTHEPMTQSFSGADLTLARRIEAGHAHSATAST